MSSAKLNIVVNAQAAMRSLGAFNTALNGLDRSVGRVTGRMKGAFSRVTGAVFSLKGALTGLGLGLIGNEIVQTTLKVERIKVAFRAFSNDAKLAERQFNELRKRSNELGVNFLTTADSFKTFNTAAQFAGLTVGQTEKIFNSFLTASAAMKLSNDELSGAMRAVQQMFSKGTVQAEELRGQLGERLPGAFSMSAQAMGVTTKQLGKMLENGEVLATDLVPKLAEALQNKFGPAAIEASYSATAQFNRFTNAVDTLKAALGQSGLVSVLAGVAGKIVEFIKDASFADWVANTLIGFAAFFDKVQDVVSRFGDIRNGIKSVYESLRSMYNAVNDFTGGMLAEMGLLGFIIMGGKRKGGFIGVAIAILAGAADLIITWAGNTIAAMLMKVQGMLPVSMQKETTNFESYLKRDGEGYGTPFQKYHYGNESQKSHMRGDFHGEMAMGGYTNDGSGNYSRMALDSAVPGMVAIYQSLDRGIQNATANAEEFANGNKGFTVMMNNAFDAVYAKIGLNTGGGLGPMADVTTSGYDEAGLNGNGRSKAGNVLRAFAENLRRELTAANAANTTGASVFGSGPTAPVVSQEDGLSGKALTAFNKQKAAMESLRDGFVDSFKDMNTYLTDYNRLLNNSNEQMTMGEYNAQRFGNGVKAGFEQALASCIDLKRAGLDLVTKGFTFLDNAIQGFIDGTKVSFKAFTAEILAYLAKLMVRMLIFKSIAGTAFGDFIGVPESVTPFGGQAAGGGSIQRGRGYLVGERGPEMFYPRTGGHMVANGAGGGGNVTINNNYDFSNADESVAARLGQQAEAIKAETFAKVFGAIEQGGRFAKATGRR